MTVVLAAACRTPFTTVDGGLAGWHPVDLTAVLMNEAVARAGLTGADIDEVWVGCAEPVGAQGADMARAAALTAGWPDHIGGTVVDRGETSGSAAVHAAIAAIRSGEVRRVVVAGVGVSSVVAPGAAALGRVYGRPWGEGPAGRVEDRGGLHPPPRAAELVAGAIGASRADQDAIARRSHDARRGVAAPAIVAVGARPGDAVAVQRGALLTSDDHRAVPDDPTALPPAFDETGTVTAFSFAPAVDGVAAVVLQPEGPGRASLIGLARAAGDPLDPAGGVERAWADLSTRTGLGIDDVTRWEVLEQSAAGLAVTCDRLGIDPRHVNLGGGTLAVGDAGAAEELRLTVDGVAAAAVGDIVATVAAGTGGSAVTVWQRTAGDGDDDVDVDVGP